MTPVEPESGTGNGTRARQREGGARDGALMCEVRLNEFQQKCAGRESRADAVALGSSVSVSAFELVSVSAAVVVSLVVVVFGIY